MCTESELKDLPIYLYVDKSKQQYIKKTFEETENPSPGEQAKTKTQPNDEREHSKYNKHIYKHTDTLIYIIIALCMCFINVAPLNNILFYRQHYSTHY